MEIKQLTEQEKKEIKRAKADKELFIEMNDLSAKVFIKEVKSIIRTGKTCTVNITSNEHGEVVVQRDGRWVNPETGDVAREAKSQKIFPNLTQTKTISSTDYAMCINIFKFISEKVCNLSPEKLDALWSSELIKAMQINHLVDKIVAQAPRDVLKDCLFSQKKICLRLAYPEYYEATYGKGYDIMEVLNASGNTLRQINNYGRIKTQAAADEEKGNYRSPNFGTIVDSLIMEAYETFFDIQGLKTVEEKLDACAKAKLYGMKKLGVYKIFTARENYQSLLDFYYFNLPAQVQKEYTTKYIDLKKPNAAKDKTNVSIVLDAIARGLELKAEREQARNNDYDYSR